MNEFRERRSQFPAPSAEEAARRTPVRGSYADTRDRLAALRRRLRRHEDRALIDDAITIISTGGDR